MELAHSCYELLILSICCGPTALHNEHLAFLVSFSLVFKTRKATDRRLERWLRTLVPLLDDSGSTSAPTSVGSQLPVTSVLGYLKPSSGFQEHAHTYTCINNKVILRFISCVWVFSLLVCLCTTYVPGAHRKTKRVLCYPGTRITDSTMWVLGINPDCLEEQPVCLTTELSLQSLKQIFI